MRVLKYGEKDRTVMMMPNVEGRKQITGWVIFSSAHLIDSVMIQECEERYPDGLTYDEAYKFLGSK